MPAPPAPSQDDSPAPSRRRRAGRTAALIAIAAALGVIGGTAVGYGIQAEREPTPLPALSRPNLAYPERPLPKDQVPEPLTAAEDRKVKTDGDLRKLLLPKPAGARKSEDIPESDGWMSVADYASGFVNEGYMLESLSESEIRRVAATAWDSGEHRETTIRLVQFRSSSALGAARHAERQREYMPEEDHARNDGDLLKGTEEGRYYLYPVQRKAGYLDLYRARAVFHRGDVMVEINIFDTEKKISKNDIRLLAERQLERL
ncbi:hypothetical protein ACWDX6_11070 [Streptomyces sp. NPDC003027]